MTFSIATKPNNSNIFKIQSDWKWPKNENLILLCLIHLILFYCLCSVDHLMDNMMYVLKMILLFFIFSFRGLNEFLLYCAVLQVINLSDALWCSPSFKSVLTRVRKNHLKRKKNSRNKLWMIDMLFILFDECQQSKRKTKFQHVFLKLCIVNIIWCFVFFFSFSNWCYRTHWFDLLDANHCLNQYFTTDRFL